MKTGLYSNGSMPCDGPLNIQMIPLYVDGDREGERSEEGYMKCIMYDRRCIALPDNKMSST